MVEDVLYPSIVRQKTSGGTAARSAERLSYPVGFSPRDLTVFARLARPIWADITGTLPTEPRLYNLATGAPNLWVDFRDSSRTVRSFINTAGTDANVTQSVPAGAELTICTQYRELTAGGRVKLDVGAGFGSESSAATAFSAFGDQILEVGHFDGGSQLDGALYELKIAAGLYTLAQMEQLL
jgi:hypothetical protein